MLSLVFLAIRRILQKKLKTLEKIITVIVKFLVN